MMKKTLLEKERLIDKQQLIKNITPIPIPIPINKKQIIEEDDDDDDNFSKSPSQVVIDIVNLIGRLFYTESQVIILQCLLTITSPITDIELSNKINLSYREVKRLLADLENDLLIFHYTEEIEKKDYELYCINYDSFINVVKYRLHKLKKWVNDQIKDKQLGYFCVKCDQGYDEFELMGMMSTNGNARCSEEDCDGEVIEDIEEFKERTGSEIPLSEVMEKQLGDVFKMIKETEKFVVPLSSRCNVNSICTIEDAESRNRRFKKIEGLQGTGSKYDNLLKDYLLLNKRVEVNIDDQNENDNKIAQNVEENTPFFLKENENYLDRIEFLRGNRNVAGKTIQIERLKDVDSSEFNENLQNLLDGDGKKGGDVMMEDEEGEVEEEKEGESINKEVNEKTKSKDEMDIDNLFPDLPKEFNDEEDEDIPMIPKMGEQVIYEENQDTIMGDESKIIHKDDKDGIPNQTTENAFQNNDNNSFFNTPIPSTTFNDIEIQDEKMDIDDDNLVQDDDSSAFVYVGGIRKKFSEISEEDEEKMTEQEYKQYGEMLSKDMTIDW